MCHHDFDDIAMEDAIWPWLSSDCMADQVTGESLFDQPFSDEEDECEEGSEEDV